RRPVTPEVASSSLVGPAIFSRKDEGGSRGSPPRGSLSGVMGTFQMKKREALAQRQWFIVDATDKVLGRLAVEVAKVLRGKHKPSFTRHEDVGDFVFVINAREVRLTGSKPQKKLYVSHSEYPGGIQFTAAQKMLEEKPEALVHLAVKGM